MLYGSSHTPLIKVIQSILNNAGRIIRVHPKLLIEQWAKDELDPQMHMLMESGECILKFVKGMCTLSNRKILKLFLNVLSVSTAMNNIHFPLLVSSKPTTRLNV